MCQRLGGKVALVNQLALSWCVLDNAAEDWTAIIMKAWIVWLMGLDDMYAGGGEWVSVECICMTINNHIFLKKIGLDYIHEPRTQVHQEPGYDASICMWWKRARGSGCTQNKHTYMVAREAVKTVRILNVRSTILGVTGGRWWYSDIRKRKNNNSYTT